MAKNPKDLPPIESWPKAMSAPLDRAYLRPLRLPLWDTEIYKDTKKLSFFVRGIDGPMSFDFGVKKTETDTCLELNGMLSQPIEFSVLGFNLFVEDAASDEDKARIMDGGVLRFGFGPRKHDGIPLIALPRRRQKPDMEDVIASILRHGGTRINHLSVEEIRKMAEERSGVDVPEDADYYPYNLGRALFKIKPQENFGVDVLWGRPPVVSRPLRITAIIEGLKWMPL